MFLSNFVLADQLVLNILIAFAFARSLPHSTSVRTPSFVLVLLSAHIFIHYCISVHSDLDSVSLFAGMREWSVYVAMFFFLDLLYN